MSGPLLPPDCSVGPGMADVIVTSIGGRNPVVMEANEIGATWEVNQPSTLTADLPLSTLIAEYGTPDGLLGHWLSWYGNALGAWAGVVTAVNGDPANGKATVHCVDFSHYLDKRNLPISGKVLSGCAGGLADVLCKYGERDDTLWLSAVDYEDAGDLLAVTMTGQDLLQQLKQNSQDADQEFYVSPDRVLIWRNRIGRDLTASVQLNEGVEIAASTPAWDTTNVVNDLVIVPAKQTYSTRYARRVQDTASVDQIGRRQDRFTTSNAVRPSAVRSIGQRRVARSAALGRTLSLDVVNVNNCLASFREGDAIRVVLPRSNLALDVRVIQRGYTVSDGIMLLTTEMLA